MGRTSIENRIAMLTGVVLVLLVALALGMVARRLRLGALGRPETRMQTQTVEPEAVIASEAPPDSTEQEEMESAATQEQEVVAETEYEYAPQETAESIESPIPAAGFPQGQAAPGFGDWRSAWADLNLTEEEQARLREGFRLAVERWQNMSEEERQAQIDRMRADWDRWQNMSDEEKEAASQRNRERFEQWRESGEVELPELSLD